MCGKATNTSPTSQGCPLRPTISFAFMAAKDISMNEIPLARVLGAISWPSAVTETPSSVDEKKQRNKSTAADDGKSARKPAGRQTGPVISMRLAEILPA